MASDRTDGSLCVPTTLVAGASLTAGRAHGAATTHLELDVGGPALRYLELEGDSLFEHRCQLHAVVQVVQAEARALLRVREVEDPQRATGGLAQLDVGWRERLACSTRKTAVALMPPHGARRHPPALSARCRTRS